MRATNVPARPLPHMSNEARLTPDTAALVVAAGRGTRMSGEVPKQYRALDGVPVLRRALMAFTNHPRIARVVPVIHPDDHAAFDAASAGLSVEAPVAGGATRQESVHRGLEALADAAPACVLIHDGARPLVSASLIDRVLGALDGAPGAVPALEVADTLKRGDGATVAETVDRTGLYRVQTPQGFRYADILAAHRSAGSNDFTDDAAIAEAAGHTIALVPGDEANLKITLEDDLVRATAWLAAARETRVGSGFDVHRFAPGAAVRLGGIDIPHDQGLSGHSDADVALHALTDAILGAIGDGDIGSHFPPSDERWKNADSAQFLAHAGARLADRGGRIVHLDLTIVCEAPKIGPHRDAMRARIAEILAIGTDRVAVKATTTEGLGFMGRREGIAAQATATVSLEGPA
jgi:2-C-methyl-D-erythritol 4-phosphate cytidylyltransferase/2-C-methyl-D-erythritol 2,4-cyclodiphosphate synthase